MIEITELTKEYSGILAIKSLTLSIHAGTIFGLVGPNGAGKSTTINILTGIGRPSSGRIQMLGLDYEKDLLQIKKQIGVVPEMMALFDGLTAKEHLRFVGKMYQIDEAEAQRRTNELLELLELDGVASRFIETYSQGMKKKLSFASAVVHRPRILFLDEPFENVDPISRKVMKEIIVTVRKNGGAVLITSHSLETLESVCDEVAIINKGKLVFQSRTEDIRKKIKDEVSQETYQSLEEIFIDVVSKDGEQKEKKKLSWL